MISYTGLIRRVSSRGIVLSQSCWSASISTTTLIQPIQQQQQQQQQQQHQKQRIQQKRNELFFRDNATNFQVRRTNYYPTFTGSSSSSSSSSTALFSTNATESVTESSASASASASPVDDVPRDRMGYKIVPIVWTTHRLSKESIAKVDALFHKILWLDVFETQMVIDTMNERLGQVHMTPKQRKALSRQLESFAIAFEGGSSTASSTDNKDAVQEEVVEKVKLVDLKLVSYDDKSKIKVIKEIRSIVDGLGLKEAKELVEGAPKTVHKGIKPELAEEMKAKLEAAGAKVEIS